MTSSSQESLDARYGVESSAQLILDVAKAASSHLELAEVLESLIVSLKPTIRFDAVAVSVIEGEYARLHSLHVERVGRRPGESVDSVIARVASSINLPHKKVTRERLSKHHLGEVAASHKPYVCADLQAQQRFAEDEQMLQFGVRSYISLPLMKHGELLGAVDFVAFEKRLFDDGAVQLLQDVSEIVSIAVS